MKMESRGPGGLSLGDPDLPVGSEFRGIQLSALLVRQVKPLAMLPQRKDQCFKRIKGWLWMGKQLQGCDPLGIPLKIPVKGRAVLTEPAKRVTHQSVTFPGKEEKGIRRSARPYPRFLIFLFA